MSVEQEIKNLKKNKIIARSEHEIDVLVDNLMKNMSLEEKIGQLSQSHYMSNICTGPEFDSADTVENIRNGKVGSIINCTDINAIYSLQKIAVEESKLHIPLMFMLDVIHGLKTSFPSPLQMACSFDDNLVEKVCKASAFEAAHSGINVTFSPMLDLVRDARWGRVNESFGEDTVVGKRMAKAYVNGYQGKGLHLYDSIGACAKHFLGYGAVESGRDYSRMDLSPVTIYDKYLPPFAEAVKNDVLSVMLSFSALNGIPMTMHEELVRNLLKEKLGFDGFTISDYTATEELLCHKSCKDRYDVAKKCIKAGLDHEMIATCFSENLLKVCVDNPEYENYVNDSCRRILKAKYRLGLFDDPYKNIYDNPDKYCMTDDIQKIAYDMTAESLVMLKNDNILPFKNKKIALYGLYADNKSVTGPWESLCNLQNNHTIYESLLKSDCEVSIEFLPENASNYDICILCVGEDEILCGEGRSKTDINLDKDQIELIEKVYAVNQNIVGIIISGRPLVITPVVDKLKAIIVGFYPGLMTGEALRDIMTGKISPSGKLSISLPEHVGQLPISYDDYPSGRPVMFHNIKDFRFESHFIDRSNYPLFTLGDGLTYNQYIYSEPVLSKTVLNGINDFITVDFDITNAGNYDTEEIAYMFIESLYSVPIRPTNELKDYKRINIKSGNTEHLQFVVNFETLCHHSSDLEKIVENGEYLIKIGPNLKSLKTIKIKYFN